MLLRTHYVFSTGVLAFLGSLITRDPFDALLFAGSVSVLANSLIDWLGHEMVRVEGKDLPRRTPLTHTWFRSIFWGFLTTTLLFLLFARETEPFVLLFLFGILVGPSHMLLDVFTEKGIYVKKEGKWVRYALAHFKYDDPFANGLAMLIGFVLGAVALTL